MYGVSPNNLSSFCRPFERIEKKKKYAQGKLICVQLRLKIYDVIIA